MSVSNTVTKVEEFDFEDEALEVLETDAELTSDEELVAVEGASEDVREEFDASAKSLDATQMYLSEIGFSPLLTAEEEVLYVSVISTIKVERPDARSSDAPIRVKIRSSGPIDALSAGT